MLKNANSSVSIRFTKVKNLSTCSTGDRYMQDQYESIRIWKGEIRLPESTQAALGPHLRLCVWNRKRAKCYMAIDIPALLRFPDSLRKASMSGCSWSTALSRSAQRGESRGMGNDKLHRVLQHAHMHISRKRLHKNTSKQPAQNLTEAPFLSLVFRLQSLIPSHLEFNDVYQQNAEHLLTAAPLQSSASFL